jgi:hypothetical protein
MEKEKSRGNKKKLLYPRVRIDVRKNYFISAEYVNHGTSCQMM